MNSFVYSHNGYDQMHCHINGLRSERIFKQLAQTDTIALLEIIGTNNTNRMEVKGETIYWWVSISVRLVAFLGAYFRKGKGREGALLACLF